MTLVNWRLAVLSAASLLAACGGGSDLGVDAGVGTSGSPTTTPGTTPGNDTPPGRTPNVPAPTEIGTPIGATVSATIGASGGQLATADGTITVIVPAGAFATDQTVAIQEITNEAHGAKGRAFRISPEGLSTPVPMTIHFHYNDDNLLGTALPYLSIAYQDANRLWRRYSRPTVNTTERTLSVQTTHFSDWSMVTGAQLLPHSAHVRVGQSLALTIVHCETEEPEGGEDELIVPLVVHECAPSPAAALTSRNWSVNGAVGGSAGAGAIVANANPLLGQAIYTAPSSKPTPNVVAVSVQHTTEQGVDLLVANVAIEEQLIGCQALSSVERFNAELSFDQFSFTAIATDLRHTGTHYGYLRGTLQRIQNNATFGFWISYLSPLADGRIHANDEYAFTPPSGDGFSGTIDVNSAPHVGMDAPSFIGLKVNYETCTFDLFGSFIGNGTSIRDGQIANHLVGIGGLYLFDQPIRIEQGSSLLLQGSLSVQAKDDIETTGYSPLEPVSTEWNISGGTTARWSIAAQ